MKIISLRTISIAVKGFFCLLSPTGFIILKISSLRNLSGKDQSQKSKVKDQMLVCTAWQNYQWTGEHCSSEWELLDRRVLFNWKTNNKTKKLYLYSNPKILSEWSTFPATAPSFLNKGLLERYAEKNRHKEESTGSTRSLRYINS